MIDDRLMSMHQRWAFLRLRRRCIWLGGVLGHTLLYCYSNFVFQAFSNVPIFVLDDKYVLGIVIGLCDEQPAPCENSSLGRLPEPVSQI
jgi:hypothetical protein